MFLLVNCHVALIVGAPLDEAAIDRLFRYNLERSPLTIPAVSYLRGPLRALRRRDPAPADPYGFDLRSPVPVEGTDALLRAADPFGPAAAPGPKRRGRHPTSATAP